MIMSGPFSRREGWDLAVVLTDLPLRIGRRQWSPPWSLHL
jgi:hypothetical protein